MFHANDLKFPFLLRVLKLLYLEDKFEICNLLLLEIRFIFSDDISLAP